VAEGDIVSFTGSADTATRIRAHANVLRRSVRVNVEADSINSAILGPESGPGTDLFDLLVKEVVREMMIKAGQKCTAIRRVLVPRQHLHAAGEAIAAKLTVLKVGNPRNAEVKVGPVVNKAHQAACLAGLRQLKQECAVLFGGDERFGVIDADAERSAFVQPTLLACKNGIDAKFVHDTEVFGPAATLVAYDNVENLVAIARRGLGSLVASIFSNDPRFIETVVLGIGDLHGRLMVVDSSVGSQFTGHGTWCQVACTAGRAGPGAERSSPDCAPCCFITGGLWCKGRRAASPRWRGYRPTPVCSMHKPTRYRSRESDYFSTITGRGRANFATGAA
jgi:3,4-dehydroadipyl-CoA semialdehyde dehydrogenase